MSERDDVLGALSTIQGQTGHEVADRVKVPLKAVMGWLWTFLGEELAVKDAGGRWTRTLKRGTTPVTLGLTPDRRSKLTEVAAARGELPDDLIQRIVNLVIDDDLFAAVLDG